MGFYINPDTGTKEDFLNTNGREVSLTELKITDRELPVVLIHNQFFTAAGIAYNEGELKALTSSEDKRYKQFFMVPREMLDKFLPKDL